MGREARTTSFVETERGGGGKSTLTVSPLPEGGHLNFLEQGLGLLPHP